MGSPITTTTEDAVKHLKEVAIPHPWRRSICVDDCSIGYISIRPGPGNDRHRAHLGYAISADFWGKGIMTATLKMAISSVFMEVPYLVRVEGMVEEENKRSQRVLEKVGFRKEGFLRRYGFNRARGLVLKTLVVIGCAILLKHLTKSTTRWDHTRIVARSLTGEKVHSLSIDSFLFHLYFPIDFGTLILSSLFGVTYLGIDSTRESKLITLQNDLSQLSQNPQPFINEVLNSVDDMVDSAFDFFHEYFSLSINLLIEEKAQNK
ncbi:hypothetical protein U1Q18_021412 [Sarracenia purpurea var. burkii]